MSVNTVLLDFSVDPAQMKNDTQIQLLSNNIENVLRQFLTNLKLLATFQLNPQQQLDLFKVYQADGGLTATMRFFQSGLITINLEFDKNQQEIINFEKCKQIERSIIEDNSIEMKQSQTIVPLRRGLFNKYYPSSDDRLLEYDIDELVFEERTPYQKIQIVHSKSLGNMLVLDDLQNISEADLIYTETLMARGTESYKGKEIVILGGGDGALLYELLKEQPKHVIMLEIDQVVMKACAKHMRSICGNVLDQLKGPNYEIIVGDCMKTLKHYIDEGRKFDYVFGDLTDVPISTTSNENAKEMWAFIQQILQTSFEILKPEGKFMTHVIGSAAADALKIYERQLMEMKPAVKFTTSHAFIPSFLEDWVFYQVFFDRK